MRFPVPKRGNHDLKEHRSGASPHSSPLLSPVRSPLLSPSSSHGSGHPDLNPPQYLEAVAPNRDPEGTKLPVNPPRFTPVTRKSSSNVLRAMAAPVLSKQKNVPYRPSKELQSHIDKLDSGADVNAALETTLSGTRTEYFHVLPSFQMFQSILKRDDSQFNESLSGIPPTYEDSRGSLPVHTPSLSPQTSYLPAGHHENNMDALLSSTADRLNEYQMNDSTYQEENFTFADETNDQPHSPPAVASPNTRGALLEPSDHYGHTVLDNIDRLSKSNSSPLDIQIYVTKKIPQPNYRNDLETRLKEYSAGDVVNGYIVITNTSEAPVDFGLFMVSLEGTIRATERDDSDGAHSPMRYKKVLVKKFLKMYDLNASYGYAHIPSSVGVEYRAFTKDNEGCILGLPNERVLEPFQKYKKFFTFTFPEKLLDNTCMHLILPHVLPPPSFGIDKSCFFHRGEHINLNKALGYGNLDIRGTPLLTRDYAFDDISISYSIEAKFIDKLDAKDQKEAVFEHQINDSSALSTYTISRSQQYFLRFVPDIKEQMLDYYNQGSQYGQETFGTLGIGGKLFYDYQHHSTWLAIREQNLKIMREIDSKLKKESTVSEVKELNLVQHSSHEQSEESWEGIKPQLLNQELESRDDVYYQDQRMICGPENAIYGKKKKSILSSLAVIGDLKVYVQVPDEVIPYTSPRLLMRYNCNTEDNGAGMHNLMPVSSTREILELYNRDEKDLLRSVNITLQFTAHDNATKPPAIGYIEANVVCWSYNSEYPLPVKLLYDFYYTSPEKDQARNEQKPKSDHHEKVDEVERTRSNLQWVKDQVSHYISFLKTNKTMISRDSFLYIKAMQTLAIKKDTVKDFFKTVTSSSHPQLLTNELGWNAVQQGNKIVWTKDISVPLVTVNKNNITLVPNFQSCLVGRSYCLQMVVKYKGSGGDQNEFADNVVKSEVPLVIG